MEFQKTPGWLDWYAGPSKPRLKAPAGAVDAHCHVFGPGAEFPYAAGRKYTPCDASKQQLYALRDHLGFARTVIGQATCHGADNRAMIDALAHSGGKARGVSTAGREFELFVKLRRQHTNVWAKVSCPERLSVSGPPALNGEQHAYRDVIPFTRRIVETFPDRVLWGTDWPHPNLRGHMPDDGLLVDFIRYIAASAELQRKLLVDNPMRLYWPEES